MVGADVVQLLDLDAGEAVEVGQRAIRIDVAAVWLWYVKVDLVVDLQVDHVVAHQARAGAVALVVDGRLGAAVQRFVEGVVEEPFRTFKGDLKGSL